MLSCLRDTIADDENGPFLESASDRDNGDGRHVVALQGGMYSMSQRHAKVMGLREELHLALLSQF
jgi:hypothetical protein